MESATFKKPAIFAPDHEIAGIAVFLRCRHAVPIDVRHDPLSLASTSSKVQEAHAVLGHLQSRNGDAAGIGRLGRTKEDAVFRKMSIASSVEGMFAPSPTAITPFLTRMLADLL